MLLVENVVLSVFPVGEASLVAGRLRDGLGHLLDLVNLAGSSFALLAPELGLVRRGKVHVVRVDDPALLLQVEGLLVVLHVGLRQLAVVVLLVVRIELLRVGVPDEPVDAASHASTLVPSW